jgi:hypothetical protein
MVRVSGARASERPRPVVNCPPPPAAAAHAEESSRQAAAPDVPLSVGLRPSPRRTGAEDTGEGILIQGFRVPQRLRSLVEQRACLRQQPTGLRMALR